MAAPLIGLAGVSPASGEALLRPETAGSRWCTWVFGGSDDNAPGLPALAFDLRDRDRADLGGVAYMRAAARLQIDHALGSGNLDQANPSGAGRRLDRHRAHQFGAGGEFVVADPVRRYIVTERNQFVEAGG